MAVGQVQATTGLTAGTAPSYRADTGGPFIQPYTQEQTVEKILVIASYDPAAAATIAGVLGVDTQLLRSRGIVPTSNPTIDARVHNILITYFSQETIGA